MPRYMQAVRDAQNVIARLFIVPVLRHIIDPHNKRQDRVSMTPPACMCMWAIMQSETVKSAASHHKTIPFENRRVPASDRYIIAFTTGWKRFGNTFEAITS
ncbi:hypothetical protein HBI25_183690 [Parastagonospora nodorum]|uniref:Uncharacterized protein n=1 Tax=Phaeosphaeria nodorum (strain SN15 / ATCC MYA-4574 / FGSC 10173) TaxID=321614 RepID=Q0UQ38_PHANO|nr:hypothetical protein SNOG_06126 [Parastagonospora nodorum SN15]KAH3934691.1 hypothetical protein HBH54_058110 [Parastagonospora nodorum]EAT85957.1 hypothetical protein SNOG_06126 [Parastagonospora nodorum SN15]KAH4006047.1 hypothetical protein HBI10_029370 [Parastagonospora nodorum]KAH4023272.1 hypothetical protein HBI13_096980 [Parastagonospora nodorum]KAH4039379.1 hypothetical protein HBI09_047520 [Parastagonospora nodorum]